MSSVTVQIFKNFDKLLPKVCSRTIENQPSKHHAYLTTCNADITCVCDHHGF